jgi:hypothetical protein
MQFTRFINHDEYKNLHFEIDENIQTQLMENIGSQTSGAVYDMLRVYVFSNVYNNVYRNVYRNVLIFIKFNDITVKQKQLERAYAKVI